jgi:transcriptional regulator with XRE-family HTH domain
MKHRIKEVLKEKGMTASTLAGLVDITQPNLSNILNDKNNPSIETLEKIAFHLGVSIGELFQQEAELYGLVTYKGKTYKIDSVQVIEALLSDCKE